MTYEKQPTFYLLGESNATTFDLPTGQVMTVTEFMTLTKAGYNTLAIFLSRLDAEIFRQYENRKNPLAGSSDYVVIRNQDSRLALLRLVEGMTCSLVTGFAIDKASQMLTTTGGIYSAMLFNLSASKYRWILDGTSEPSNSIMASVRELFARAGEPDYLAELAELDNLKDNDIQQLARDAMSKIGTSPVGEGRIAAVFSPRRKAWLKLDIGGSHDLC